MKHVSIYTLFFLGISLKLLFSNNYFGFQECITSVFDQKKSAIVRVFGVSKSQADSGQNQPSDSVLDVCTGFFISREGHVMTVANVVNGAQALWVAYDKIPYPAELVGFDNNTNIAIIRLLKPPSNLPFLHLGEFLETPKPATMLLAVTCTLGQEASPSLGMVTGWHTDSFDNTVFPTTFLRTNIPSILGEGGSPVFDLMGRFAGVIVDSIDEIRSSFIIPAKAVMHIRDDLVFSGKVSYAYVGIDLDEKSIMTADSCIIKELIPGGPAEGSGLKMGDKILEFDNSPIQSLMDFRNATFFVRPTQVVSIKVQREDKELKFPVRLSEKPMSLLNLAAVQPEKPLEQAKAKEKEAPAPMQKNPVASQKKVEAIIKKSNYWNTYLKAL